MGEVSPRWRRVLAAGAAVAVLAGACGGGDDDAEQADGGDTTTTVDTRPFEERAAIQELNLAATGMNIVAADVSLRMSTDGGEYCRTKATEELAPHRSVLEKAADPLVVQGAQAALAELGEAITACAGGTEATAVHAVLDRYRARFETLRKRIEARLTAG